MAKFTSVVAEIAGIPPWYFVAIFLGIFVLYQTITYATDPLRSVPGPFWARFTRLWYLCEVAGGHFEKTNVRLHRKYGMLFQSLDVIRPLMLVKARSCGSLPITTPLTMWKP